MTRLTIKCRSCFMMFRIVVPEVPTTHLPPKYCLYCGSTNTHLSQDSDQDVWEVLAEGFGLPISVLQLFYSAWIQDPEGHPKFRDYLDQSLKTIVAQNPTKYQQEMQHED